MEAGGSYPWSAGEYAVVAVGYAEQQMPALPRNPDWEAHGKQESGNRGLVLPGVVWLGGDNCRCADSAKTPTLSLFMPARCASEEERSDSSVSPASV